MKKIKFLIILLLPILLLTGCDNNENKIDKAIKSTAIKEKNVKSYRAKIDIKSKDKNINYIVLNEGNSKYSYSSSEQEDDLEYDFSNTDIFIETLENITDIKKENDKDYDKYTFSISKKYLNEILKIYGLEVNSDGTGYIYIDKDGHIYMINYNVDITSINASYTRINSVK